MNRLKILLGVALLFLTLSLFHVGFARDSGLVYHEVQIVDETGAKVTDITSINIYAPDPTTNATIYMDAGGNDAITQAITTSSTNTTFTQSEGTLYWWGPDGYDFTFTNGTNISTNAGHRTRTSSEGRLYFPSYLTDITSASYEDGESITMGDDSDFVINGGTTADRLTITPVTNNAQLYCGTTGSVLDFLLWGDTAGYDVMWDASDNRLEFADNAILSVGTGLDWYIAHNGTTTTVTGAHTNASAVINSTDVTYTGNAYNVEWDNSSDTFHLLDNAELGIGGATTADGDVVFKHDGTTLSMTTIRSDEPWTIGGTSYGFDITYAFKTAGQFRTDYDGDFINLTDDMDLRFGTGASANGDLMISSNSSNVLAITQVVADTGTMTWGASGTDIPLIWYGETAGAEITTTGDTQVYDGIDVTHNDDDVVKFGDSGEITMEYDEDGDDNLLVKGAVDLSTTYVEFREAPLCVKKAGAGAATGTAGDENLLISGFPGAIFEYHIVGTATAVSPVLGAEGLDIGLDDAENDGIEITEGITARSRSAFTMGTDAFYLEVKFYVTDASGSDVMMIGFRSDEAYQADPEDYTDMAAVGLNGADWYTWTIDDDGATTKTDVTPSGGDCGDTEAHIVRINVAADLAVTYEITGAAPTGVAAHDIDTGDVVIPFLYLIHDADISEAFQIDSWECGLQ